MIIYFCGGSMFEQLFTTHIKQITGLGTIENYPMIDIEISTNMQMVADNNFLYFGFGLRRTDPVGPTADFYKYDIINKVLTKLPDSPSNPGANGTMVKVGRLLIYSRYEVVYIFNMDTEVWTTPTWTGGSGAARYGGMAGFAFERNGKAMFVRQRPGSAAQIQVMEYDPSANTWGAFETFGNPETAPTAYFWGAVVNNLLYIFGIKNSLPFSLKYITLDLTTKKVTTITSDKEWPTTYTPAVVYNDEIYHTDGIVGPSPKTMYKFNPELGIDISLPVLPREVRAAGMTLIDDKIYIIGGQSTNPNVYYSDLFSYQLTE